MRQHRAPEVEMDDVEPGERPPEEAHPPALESQSPDTGRAEKHVRLVAECAWGICRADTLESQVPLGACQGRGVAADKIGHVEDSKRPLHSQALRPLQSDR